MKDIILHKFLIPLPESYAPRIDVISEDDLSFLQTVGNYMYEKRRNPKEALKSLSQGLKTADRRSELYDEIAKASQDILSGKTTIYTELDLSSFNESELGDLENTACTSMANIMSGTFDGHFNESDAEHDGYGLYPFESENAQVYMPVLERWIKEYRKTHKHSLAINEFLSSVTDSLRLNGTMKEVIAHHKAETIGQVSYIK